MKCFHGPIVLYVYLVEYGIIYIYIYIYIYSKISLTKVGIGETLQVTMCLATMGIQVIKVTINEDVLYAYTHLHNLYSGLYDLDIQHLCSMIHGST